MNLELELEKNRSKKSVNTDFYQPLNLDVSSMVVPVSNINETINIYKVFEDERNSSTKYRLNITLNPIMSNILSNKLTEITDKYGNKLTGQDRLDAIQKIDDNTYNYKIGYDIFDNNFTRVETFKTGNTLNDFTGTTLSDLVSIQDAIKNNVTYNDGWVGFFNKSKINNNKMFTLKKPCEKIDLYPTRDYFLFTPFYVEGKLYDNWDYVITYPYDNYTESILVKDINGVNGIPIITGNTISLENSNYLEITTAYNHGLSQNDIIKLKIDNNGNDNTYLIYNIGDITGSNKTNKFIIDINKYTNLTNIKDFSKYRIVRTVNKVDSIYYIRRFKKLPNLIDDDDIITENNIKSKLLTGDTLYNKESYKLGFSKNIYGDPVHQIQYIDSIDISLIKDNLKRPLTEIFFSLIKKNINSENIEPYNTFTEVKSGINESSVCYNYSNIRRINGVDNNETPIESNITSSGSTIHSNNELQTNIFMGDIVEYNATTVKEYKLEDICHRFNTVQRENYGNFVYSDFFGDTTNMLLNSGFLEGINYWYFNKPSSYPLQIVESNISGSGKAIRVTTSTNTNSGIWTNGNGTLSFESGKTYTVSFYAKSTANLTLDRVGVEGVTQYQSFNLTANWSKFKFTFTASDNQVHALIFYKSSTISSTFLITNVKIENNSTSSEWHSCPHDADGNYKFVNKTLNMTPFKEGYYYKPHYSIKLKNYSAILNEGEMPELIPCSDIIQGIDRNNEIVNLNGKNDDEIKSLLIKLPSTSGLTNFDMVRITNNSNDNYENFKITLYGNHIVLPYNKEFMPIISDQTITNYTIRKYKTSDIPDYAQDMFNGNCLWRNILKEGIFDSDSTNMDELIYTNGNLYVNKSINFFLRRQDPFGEYGLIKNTFPYDVYGNKNIDEINNNKISSLNTVC